jgi:cleavage and polyadenylation specificity factor subunit 2
MELLQTFPINRPKVVLAVPPSMSHGPSRWLFTAMAATEGNVVLLTSPGEDGTLTRELYDAWRAQGQGLGELAVTTGQKLVEVSEFGISLISSTPKSHSKAKS